MNLDFAYQILYTAALIVLAVLIGIMLVRAIIGPRITDRILSINMLGTMVICSIAILSQMLKESYLVDVALIYAMLSFVAVLILATTYLPANPEEPVSPDAEHEKNSNARGAGNRRDGDGRRNR